MVSWAAWRAFPVSGQVPDVPVSPGVYEVRHVGSGRLVAFGDAANLAQALTALTPRQRPGFWNAFRRRTVKLPSDLEYRVCATPTARDARNVATQLLDRRDTFMKRRSAAV